MTQLDPVILRNHAAKCRRLASTLGNAEDVAQLCALADEYDALATDSERIKARRHHNLHWAG